MTRAPWTDTSGPKTALVHVRVSAGEQGQLRALAEHHGTTVSALIRSWLKTKASALPGTGLVKP